MITINQQPYKFDAIIILNGEISEDDIQFIINNPDTTIIATDGATNKIYPNITPKYIIGDMDSIDDEIKKYYSKKSEIVIDNNQNKFDSEKAIELAISKNLSNIIVIGCNGGELEHTINNYSIITQFAKQNINIKTLTKNRIGQFIQSNIILNTTTGENISLIPINNATISSNGLK